MTDLELLINSLDDSALSFCKECLYDVLNFNTIKMEDVRRIDLIEKLNNHRNWAPQANNEGGYRIKITKQDGGINDIFISLNDKNTYPTLLHWYLDCIINCEKESRSEKYKKKAYSILFQISSKSTTPLELLEDLTTIFILLLREYDKQSNKTTLPLLKNFGITKLQKKDIDILKRFFLQKKVFPSRLKLEPSDSLWNIITHPAKTITRVVASKKDIESVINYLYIYTVLYFCRELQNSGEFLIDDKETTDE